MSAPAPHPRTPPEQALADAAAALRLGHVVAFPTETVYGLGADALNAAAVREVFRLKGRPARNPVIVHVADETMARALVREWPPEAAALAAAFWPGSLTLVLPKADAVPPEVTAGGPNVAVRCPDHPIALELIRQAGPLVGPSANPSGRISPTTAGHVRESLGSDVRVLDGGPCRVGIESTVLLLAGGVPRILRPGAITAEQIAAVLGREVVIENGPAPSQGPLASPGRLERHYAPQAPAVLFTAAEWPEILARLERERRVVVITHEARTVPPPHAVLPIPSDPGAYGAALYAALREADLRGASLVAVEEPPASGESSWSAVRDRLGRATLPWGEHCRLQHIVHVAR